VLTSGGSGGDVEVVKMPWKQLATRKNRRRVVIECYFFILNLLQNFFTVVV
jgi:hypothetical protein